MRVIGLARDATRATLLRERGIRPLVLDLDRRDGLERARGLARWMVDLAPPHEQGSTDARTARLIRALTRPPGRGPRHTRRDATPLTRRWVYISTTGVYGDAHGALIDETRPASPVHARSARRLDAERRFRAAARAGLARASILRVPGIYALERLPVPRLRQGLPALRTEDDVFTNHVHADDLARIAWTSLFRGQAGRVVNAVDDTDLKMGEWFDKVADTYRLARPERLPRAELAQRVSPMMMSFMSESRRLRNERLHRELRVRLRYPTVDALLSAIVV